MAVAFALCVLCFVGQLWLNLSHIFNGGAERWDWHWAGFWAFTVAVSGILTYVTK